MLEEGPSDGLEAGEGDIVEVYYVGVLSEDGTRVRLQLRLRHPVPHRGRRRRRDPRLGRGPRRCPPRRSHAARHALRARLRRGRQPAGDPAGRRPHVRDGHRRRHRPARARRPTELELTVVEEGPSDGPEAEKFDTVNVYSRGYLDRRRDGVREHCGEWHAAADRDRRGPGRRPGGGADRRPTGRSPPSGRPGRPRPTARPASRTSGSPRTPRSSTARGRRRRLAAGVRAPRGGARGVGPHRAQEGDAEVGWRSASTPSTPTSSASSSTRSSRCSPARSARATRSR